MTDRIRAALGAALAALLPAIFAGALTASAGTAEPDPERYDAGFRNRLAKRAGEDFCWQANWTAEPSL